MSTLARERGEHAGYRWARFARSRGMQWRSSVDTPALGLDAHFRVGLSRYGLRPASPGPSLGRPSAVGPWRKYDGRRVSCSAFRGEAARFYAAWQNHMLTRGDGYQWARDRAQTPPLREELGTLFHLAECGSQKLNYFFRTRETLPRRQKPDISRRARSVSECSFSSV